MSFMTVPAQREAVQVPGTRGQERSDGPLILGGHSKGGNLALYAACHTTDAVRKRIRKVYSFDGPGVDKQTLDGQEYPQVRGHDRAQRYIPQSSVIGMLLCYHPDYLVVKSNAVGFCSTTCLPGILRTARLLQLEELDLSTRISNEALQPVWLDQHTRGANGS